MFRGDGDPNRRVNIKLFCYIISNIQMPQKCRHCNQNPSSSCWTIFKAEKLQLQDTLNWKGIMLSKHRKAHRCKQLLFGWHLKCIINLKQTIKTGKKNLPLISSKCSVETLGIVVYEINFQWLLDHTPEGVSCEIRGIELHTVYTWPIKSIH